jgi:predicted  nucleic acid-binding Zn-ribbon protein
MSDKQPLVEKNNGSSSYTQNKDPKIQEIQQNIKQVQGIMEDNIKKTLDRGDKMQDLEDKSRRLEEDSKGFNDGAKRLHRQLWWKNKKMTMIIILVILAIIGILALVIYLSVRK